MITSFLQKLLSLRKIWKNTRDNNKIIKKKWKWFFLKLLKKKEAEKESFSFRFLESWEKNNNKKWYSIAVCDDSRLDGEINKIKIFKFSIP